MNFELSEKKESEKLFLEKEATVSDLLKASDVESPSNHFLARKVILDEDTYNEAIANIIERDFFPHHKKYRFQKAYLDAHKAGDNFLMKQILFEYHQEQHRSLFTPQRNSKELVTPQTISSFSPSLKTSSTEIKRKQNPDDFLTEDLKVGRKPDTTNLSLNQFFSKYICEDDASFELIMASEKKKNLKKNSWLYDTEIKAKNNELKDSNDPRNPLLGYVAKNCLMFYPTTHYSDHSKEMLMKLANSKKVCYENTRLSYDPFQITTSKQNKSSKFHINDINQRRVNPDGTVVSNEESSMKEIISPSPAKHVYDSPVMTWGSIEDTPLRLDFEPSLSQGHSSLLMQPETVREKAEEYLQDKATQIRKVKLDSCKMMTTYGRTIAGKRNIIKMSPAGNKLMNSTSRVLNDVGLRDSYTPKHSKVYTPQKNDSQTPTPLQGELSITKNYLTDDLL